MANITTDEKYENVVINFTDSKGRPARVDGAPALAPSDPAVLSVGAVTLAADGTSATTSVDTVGIGIARVTVAADSDLTAGVATITGQSEDITVTQGASSIASNIAVNLGVPTPKP